jgi:hypothetical protein
MRDSHEYHDEYKIKNIEIIKGKQSFLREEIDQLIEMNDSLKQPTIDIVYLSQLKQKIKAFIKDTKVKNLKGDFSNEDSETIAVDRMKRDLDQTQVSFSHINKVLLDVKNFVKKSDAAEHSIGVSLF